VVELERVADCVAPEPDAGAELHDRVRHVDEDHLREQAGGGEAGDGFETVTGPAVGGPSAPQREQTAPEQQATEEHVPAVEDERIAKVDGDE